MTIGIDTRPEHNLAVITHIGRVEDEEFLAFYRSFFGGGDFDPSMKLMVDLREADSAPRSSEVLNRIAEFVQTTRLDITAQTKVAVVAPRDLSFGLARMYDAFSMLVPWDFVVFRAMEAALAWLGLPEDSMDPPKR